MKLTRQQWLGLILTGILLVLLALLIALTKPPRAVEPTVIEPEQISAPKPEKEKKPQRRAKKHSEPRPAPEPRNPLDEEF